jgi:hypothetical protein
VSVLRPVRHWLAERVRAHVFLSLLSGLLTSVSAALSSAEYEFTAGRAIDKSLLKT